MRLYEEDFNKARGDLALSLLINHEDVVIIESKSISLTYFNGESITLRVWSAWDAENLSKQVAEKEILQGKRSFNEVLGKWNALKKLLNDKDIPCYLHSDYGMGSTKICELLEDGTIVWQVEFDE